MRTDKSTYVLHHVELWIDIIKLYFLWRTGRYLISSLDCFAPVLLPEVCQPRCPQCSTWLPAAAASPTADLFRGQREEREHWTESKSSTNLLPATTTPGGGPAVWVRVFLRGAAAEMSRHVVSVTNPNFCSLSSETEVNWGSSQYCTDDVGFAPSASRFHLVFNGIK